MTLIKVSEPEVHFAALARAHDFWPDCQALIATRTVRVRPFHSRRVGWLLGFLISNGALLLKSLCCSFPHTKSLVDRGVEKFEMDSSIDVITSIDFGHCLENNEIFSEPSEY